MEDISELMVEFVVLCDKIFLDLKVHREGMAYRKMPSLVPTLYERVQNLLQEAQIRVEESHNFQEHAIA